MIYSAFKSLIVFYAMEHWQVLDPLVIQYKKKNVEKFKC